MSEENVEVVRAIYDSWIRGDYEAFWPRAGHDGVRRSLARWVGEWDEYSFEVRQLIDFGDDVLVEGWHRGRGKTSGLEAAGLSE